MGHSWTPSDWVMIIAAVFTGITSTIAAWHARKADNKATIAAVRSDTAAEMAEHTAIRAKSNAAKLDDIHSLANGNLTRTQEELAIVIRQKDFLDKLIVELTAHCPSGTIDKAKKEVELREAEAGHRRKTDLENNIS